MYVFIVASLTTFLMGLAIWPLKIEYTVRSNIGYRDPTPDGSGPESDGRGVFPARPEALITDEILKKTVLDTDSIGLLGHRQSAGRLSPDGLNQLRQRLHVSSMRVGGAGETALLFEIHGPHLESCVAFLGKLLDEVTVHLRHRNSRQQLEQLRIKSEARQTEFDNYVRSQLRTVQAGIAQNKQTRRASGAVDPLGRRSFIRVVSATNDVSQTAPQTTEAEEIIGKKHPGHERTETATGLIGSTMESSADVWSEMQGDDRFHDLRTACIQAKSRYQEAIRKADADETDGYQTPSGIEITDAAHVVGFSGRPMSKLHFWILTICSCGAGIALAMNHRLEHGQSVLRSAEEIQEKLGLPLVGMVPADGDAAPTVVRRLVIRSDPLVAAGESLLVVVFGAIVVMSATNRMFFSELIANPYAAFSYLVTTWLS